MMDVVEAHNRVLKWPLRHFKESPIGTGPVALVDMQEGVVTVWTIEPVFNATTTWGIIIPTGTEVDNDLEFCGSCVDGEFVWHVFREMREIRRELDELHG